MTQGANQIIEVTAAAAAQTNCVGAGGDDLFVRPMMAPPEADWARDHSPHGVVTCRSEAVARSEVARVSLPP